MGDLQAEIHWPLLHPALVADEECKGRRCLKGLKLLRPHNLLLIAISPSVHFLSHLGSPLPSHLLVAGFGRVPCPGHITACLLAAPAPRWGRGALTLAHCAACLSHGRAAPPGQVHLNHNSLFLPLRSFHFFLRGGFRGRTSTVSMPSVHVPISSPGRGGSHGRARPA